MITVNPATFESVYDPTSFKDWVFILGSHQEVFDGMTSFQMHFNAIFFTSSLVALTQPLMVRYHYVCFWSFVVVEDPTNKYRNKLISILKSIKSEGGIDDNTYKDYTQQQLHHPNIMGYPKFINQGCHSDP